VAPFSPGTGTPRYRLGPEAPSSFLLQTPVPSTHEVTLTYIVDQSGVAWVAERHVEHIACARSEPVLAAGELTVDLSERKIVVLAATNQSTGYCPEADCWTSLAQALDVAGIERPDEFEHAFQFGRCRECRSLAVVKDNDFTCVECGSALDPPWDR
jgi:hypothetical protein